MEKENKVKMYESALSVYHSAQCVFEIEEEFTNNNDTETVKAESDESILMLEKQINKENEQIVNNGTTKLDDTNNINEKTSLYLNITKLNLFLPCGSLCLYLLDVISDQVLAVKYATKKEWIYAALTCIFVLLPAFYLSIFVGKTWKRLIAKGWKWWPLLLPLVFFNLEPAVQYVINYFTVRKYLKAKKEKNLKNLKKYHDKYISGNRAVSDLKYTESLMEAVPQFTLQGYIIFSTYTTLKFDDTLFLQLGSLSSSVIGLVIIIFVRHKIWLLDNGFLITEFGRALWTIGRFFSLVARVLAMTISASLYPGYTFLVLGIHWLLAVIWRYITHFMILGYIEPIFQGAADTLVARVDSLFSNVISHIVILTENIIMMTVWFCHSSEEYNVIRNILLPVVTVINVIGCSSDVLYKKYNEKFTTKIED